MIKIWKISYKKYFLFKFITDIAEKHIKAKTQNQQFNDHSHVDYGKAKFNNGNLNF